MKIKAVVFDRDGVLTYFDTAAAIAHFRPLLPISIFELMGRWQAYGKEVGFPVAVTMEEAFFERFWERLGQEFGVSAEQQRLLRETKYTRFVRAYPEVPSVLAELHQRGYRIGVLSNFTLASLEASLQAAALNTWIDAAVAAHVIGAAKPEPAAYLAILSALQVEPAEVLFFDDEQAAVDGAEMLGIRSYRVDRTQQVDDPASSILASLTNIPAIPALS